jgi:hypothetical protein
MLHKKGFFKISDPLVVPFPGHDCDDDAEEDSL